MGCLRRGGPFFICMHCKQGQEGSQSFAEGRVPIHTDKLNEQVASKETVEMIQKERAVPGSDRASFVVKASDVTLWYPAAEERNYPGILRDLPSAAKPRNTQGFEANKEQWSRRQTRASWVLPWSSWMQGCSFRSQHLWGAFSWMTSCCPGCQSTSPGRGNLLILEPVSLTILGYRDSSPIQYGRNIFF